MTVGTRRRLVSGAVITAVAGIAVWLVAGRSGDDDEAGPRSAGVSLAELKQIAAGIPHPVYWAGPRRGMQYELTRTKDGRIYIRYLPRGTEVGSSRGDFLTVGTYPQDNAFQTLKATARKQGVATIPLADGGLAFRDTNRPASVYAAYPSSDLQIEVFQPSGGGALKLVRDGRLLRLVAPASRQASVEELEALPAALAHPVYWLGPRGNSTYELTRTKDGRVYIRYLPRGATVGSAKPYVTVGSYPQRDALANVKRRAANLGATPIEVGDGGVAYIDKNRPTSAYVAYPDTNVQIELFAPDAGQTEGLLTGGSLKPIG
jgi:hypothetical protein